MPVISSLATVTAAASSPLVLELVTEEATVVAAVAAATAAAAVAALAAVAAVAAVEVATVPEGALVSPNQPFFLQ